MKLTSYSLIEIVAKHEQDFLDCPKLTYRPCIQERLLTNSLDTALIKIVVGPRRAGKSRLIQHVLQDQVVGYINFEKEQFIGVSANEILDAAKLIGFMQQSQALKVHRAS